MFRAYNQMKCADINANGSLVIRVNRHLESTAACQLMVSNTLYICILTLVLRCQFFFPFLLFQKHKMRTWYHRRAIIMQLLLLRFAQSAEESPSDRNCIFWSQLRVFATLAKVQMWRSDKSVLKLATEKTTHLHIFNFFCPSDLNY